MDDTALINRLSPESAKRRHQGLASPDWVEVHQELKQKGMTKQLVWEEHCEAYPHNHYSYPQFCHLYREWRKKQKRWNRFKKQQLSQKEYQSQLKQIRKQCFELDMVIEKTQSEFFERQIPTVQDILKQDQLVRFLVTAQNS